MKIINLFSTPKPFLCFFATILCFFASEIALAGSSFKNDDGLYTQDWFLNSFLDLRADLETATMTGKRFVVLWELRGCPYCERTHLVNFAHPEIKTYTSKNFEILQLNIIGSREVTDFDGEILSEKELAAKYAVRFTPTFQFFPEQLEKIDLSQGRDREITRMNGYYIPSHFLALFEFVAEKAYKTEKFRNFAKRKLAEYKERGFNSEAW